MKIVNNLIDWNFGKKKRENTRIKAIGGYGKECNSPLMRHST